ncbi:MAG: SHOCT-like domain-containing protein [Anaerolineae bacterium]
MMLVEERKQILKMVEEGRIGAEEAMLLLRALEQDSFGVAEEAGEAAPGARSAANAAEQAPRRDLALEEVARRARRLAWIPLGLGVGLTVISATLMYWAERRAGLGFWFYCLGLPLAFGALMIALATGSASARWLFVDVRQKPGERPERITFGFPLPLRFLRWVLGRFGHRLPGVRSPEVARDWLSLMDRGLSSDTPLIVHVDEEDGTQVRVYLG